MLERIGLDMSSAIKLYLHQIVITQGIPFPLRTANGFTVEQEQRGWSQCGSDSPVARLRQN